MAFKVGDVVMLKSGGPEMTVSETSNFGSGPQAKCQWFGGRKLEDGWFPGQSLIAVPSEQKK